MTSSPATMRAVRLSAPGPVDNLRLTTLPLPPERDGWVRIRVEAFGLNRSELKLRLGLSAGVSFPRVPGIEVVGTVDAAPAGSGSGRHADPARHFAGGVRARHGLLRRQPLRPVDGAGLLPERVPAEGRAPGGLLRRRRRPAPGGLPGDPRRGRGLALAFPVDRVYDGLEQVPQAHDDMEHDRATGKLVVRVRH